jgi:hypothetical protein
MKSDELMCYSCEKSNSADKEHESDQEFEEDSRNLILHLLCYQISVVITDKRISRD